MNVASSGTNGAGRVSEGGVAPIHGAFLPRRRHVGPRRRAVESRL